jgi:phage major head subunit gpT-like protein
MGNLTGALQQLRAERRQAQLQVEKLDQAISVIESLNGSGAVQQANQPTRIISAASRRKMAQAQRARWAKARNGSQPIALANTTASAPVKRTMSAAARRKIAAFQRVRWAKVKAQQKKAA